MRLLREEHRMSIKPYLGGLLLMAGIAAGSLCAVQTANAAGPFTLESATFKDGGQLQVKNAGNRKSNKNCVGQNISPPLSWKNEPAGTKSFAIVVRDLLAGNGMGGVHWLAYGISASVHEFKEDEASKPSPKFVGGLNSPKQLVYGGPCTPPDTTWHHYIFTLIATDLDPKALKPGLTLDQFFAALKGHAKGGTEIIGYFKHP
jgi:Raf kinase inhibitor-like YbhB/YbcL family protein